MVDFGNHGAVIKLALSVSHQAPWGWFLSLGMGGLAGSVPCPQNPGGDPTV